MTQQKLLTTDRLELDRIIATALKEDIGGGDITSQLLIPQESYARMQFVAREDMVACGLFLPEIIYGHLSSAIKVEIANCEGKTAARQAVLATAEGSARDLLAGERVILNLMQRMCGIATLTQRYVKAVSGTNAILLDTRKTMPGLRLLDKYAVQAGGGRNHRMRLDDMVLIKDNHIALCRDIASAVRKARAGTDKPVVVECDTLAQVKEALPASPDRILLDNMSLDELREAVSLSARKMPLEASGGVTLETVRAIAETGVDYISVGQLTHSARAMDIGADLVIL